MAGIGRQDDITFIKFAKITLVLTIAVSFKHISITLLRQVNG